VAGEQLDAAIRASTPSRWRDGSTAKLVEQRRREPLPDDIALAAVELERALAAAAVRLLNRCCAARI
jgi:hypothetical protein